MYNDLAQTYTKSTKEWDDLVQKHQQKLTEVMPPSWADVLLSTTYVLGCVEYDVQAPARVCGVSHDVCFQGRYSVEWHAHSPVRGLPEAVWGPVRAYAQYI
jgi:hypothetical protein